MTSREPDPQASYLRVARFGAERPAGRAYTQLRDAIFRSPDCELSVYHLILDRRSYVTVLGDPPAETLDRRIRQVLARGTLLPHRKRALKSCNEVGPRRPGLVPGWTTTDAPLLLKRAHP